MRNLKNIFANIKTDPVDPVRHQISFHHPSIGGVGEDPVHINISKNIVPDITIFLRENLTALIL